MKKLLILLLSLLMVLSLSGCKPEKQEEEPVVADTPEVVEPAEEDIIAGGFVDVEDGTLTDELKDLFNKALEGLMGAKYEPVELVATQVVAGTNYKFLANGTKTTNPVTKGTYYVTVYKDLQGNVELLDIETIEEKQEEAPVVNNDTEDVTKMAFWVVFYDEYDNELQREALMYGSTPKYKGYLPEGFVKWTYKKTGKDVNTFVPITTNTYFKAVCNHTSATPSDPEPEKVCQYLGKDLYYIVEESDTTYTTHLFSYDSNLKKYDYEFFAIFNIPKEMIGDDLNVGDWFHFHRGLGEYYGECECNGDGAVVKNLYTVKWVNYDDSFLDMSLFPEGETPVYYGSTPTRADDSQYTYTFKEWTPAVTTVTGDITYKATYTATPIPECPYAHTGDMFYVVEVISSGQYRMCHHRYDSSVGKFVTLGLTTISIGGTDYQIGDWVHYNVATSETNACEHNGDGTETPVVYTVTFDLNGKTVEIPPQPLKVLSGNKAYKPSKQSIFGYTAEEWCKEASCSNDWDFDNDTVTSNTTLYAKWIPKTTGVAFMDEGEATTPSPVTATYGEPMPEIIPPTRDGYNFLGYYASEAFGGEQYYNADGTSAKNWDFGDATAFTLYGKWEQACLAKGTLITMADGSKELIENINRGDLVRVFDHDTGKVSSAKVMDYWQYEEKKSGLITLHFTNDIDVNIVTAHGFFNKEENRYVVLNAGNIDSYIGKHFYNVDNDSWETLLGATYSDEKVDTFFIATEGQLVTVAEGMLNIEDGLYTVLRNIYEFDENLMVDETKKAKDIQRYGLYENSDFEYLTKEAFEEYGAANLKVALGKGMITEDFLDEIREEALSYESDNIVEEYIPENIQHSVR